MNKEIRLALLICFFKLPLTLFGQELNVDWVIPPTLEVDKIHEFFLEKDLPIIAKKNNKFGLYNREGLALLKPEYNRIYALSCGWVTVYKGKEIFLFNKKLESVGLPYEKFTPQNNGCAFVYNKGDSIGLINMKGEELVPVKYTRKSGIEKYTFTNDSEEKHFTPPPNHVSEFERRLSKKNEKFILSGYYAIRDHRSIKGLLNLDRDTVVPPIYNLKSTHPKGYIKASLSKRWGVIDINNNILYPFDATQIGNWTASAMLPIRYDGESGVVQFPSAEVIIPFGIYDEIKVHHAEEDLFLVRKGKQKGVLNAKQEIIIPIEYNYIQHMSDYVVRLTKDKKGKFGFWNLKTDVKSEFIYDQLRVEEDSLLIVRRGDQYALLDANDARELISYSDFQIQKRGSYYRSHKKWNEKISATDKGRLNGLYDNKGSLVYPHDSVDIVTFSDDSYFIIPQYLDAATKAEHRTSDGKVLRTLPKIGIAISQYSPFIFNSKNSEGEYKATSFSYLDPPGKENYLHKINIKEIENLRLVKQGQFYGYTDKEGRIVIPTVLDQAEESKEGFLKIKYKGKWGIAKNPLFDFFE